MTPSSTTLNRRRLGEMGFLLILATVLYGLLPVHSAPPSSTPGHFTDLARAFLSGELAIRADPLAATSVAELIPTADPNRFFCPYPPLPAILLTPFLALGWTVKVDFACRIASVLNVLLFHSCLLRLPTPAASLTRPAALAWTMFFAFGTAVWHNAWSGGDWHLAHAVALGLLLLALRQHLAGGRPLWTGGFVGLALLTRPTAALTGLFFVSAMLGRGDRSAAVRLLIGPAVATLLLAAYNAARFGDPLDFGYTRMLLVSPGRELMDRYGQFHPHFAPYNFYWFFLAPPWLNLSGRFPWLGYDPRGMGLLWASPALVYALVGLFRGRRTDLARHAAAGILAALVPLLLYFNTGYVQFGHRFSMDYLPLVMVLTALGAGRRLRPVPLVLIAGSIGFTALMVWCNPVAVLPPWLAPMP